jgi:hypothetical protein
MDWFKTDVVSSHWYSSTSSNNLVGTEIDLRQEMHVILHGDQTHIKKGHWVVYRRFNRDVPSTNYSNRTHEGIGGPAYEYTDYLYRTRRVPVDRRGLPEDALKVGIDLTDRYIYYFEYTVVPKIGDYIFEIEWADHNLTPTLTGLKYTEKYNIRRTHDYRLEFGNIQYYIVSVDQDEVSY